MIEIHNYKKSKIAVNESIENLLNYVPAEFHKSLVIITDTNVSKFHQDKFPDVPVITIGLTEKIKTQQTVDLIIKKLLELGADRHFYLVGIGGGIVCDITGYTASIYMRGIRFGYVPTSLLAQIDASIGGKTGVNFENYKNIVGVFNQPDFVLCDFEILKTLPKEEIKNGLIEAIKHGIISSPELFEFIENNSSKILDLDRESIHKIVLESIQIKSEVVTLDEFEKDERKKLNLGHSFGHAIESLAQISHGAAVAIGLVHAAELSTQLNYCSSEIPSRITKLIQALEMQYKTQLHIKELLNNMQKDKKRNQDKIDYVFIQKIGKTTVVPITFKELHEIYKA